MQHYTKLEIAVGAFIIVGSLALAYLSVSLGGLRVFTADHYTVSARFSSVGGLKNGDPVKISGVAVGEVATIRLANYTAEADLAIEHSVKLPADTIASIRSNGLLGDAYVSLSPGAADEELAPGGKIVRTEPAISLTELIAKYAFGSPVEDSTKDGTPEDTAEEKSPFSDPLEE